MKYFSLIFMILALTFLLTGCAEFSRFYTKSSQNDERLALIDQRILELEQALSNLNVSDQNLEKRIGELSQKVDTNYSTLHESVNGLNARVERKERLLEGNLLEAQKNINNLENKLDKLNEIEKIKTDLQNQIIVLLSQRSTITGSEIGKLKETKKEEGGDIIAQRQEIINESPGEYKLEEVTIKDSDANPRKAELQSMMDEALALYRGGNYEESLNKWEEIIAIDPENLEAEFNIEIVKERMKFLSGK
ncbi:MAG: hypothetical protein QY310_07655 [Candidatus Jettenia sp. CY-1]|nr:MAG: hypothetical protein QY310_07655 [Candidatus Jettenia sp. CY-1]